MRPSGALVVALATLASACAAYDPELLPVVIDEARLEPATACVGDPLTLSWATRGASSVRFEASDGSVLPGLPLAGRQVLPGAMTAGALVATRERRRVSRPLWARVLTPADMFLLTDPESTCLAGWQIASLTLDSGTDVSGRLRVFQLSNPFMQELTVTHVSPGGELVERTLPPVGTTAGFDGRTLAGTWTIARRLPEAECRRAALALAVVVQTRCDP